MVCPDFLPLCCRYLIVKDLVFCENSLVFHSGQCPALVQDHFSLCLVLHGLNPGGVSINFVLGHMISISPTQYVGELPCPVCVESFLGFVDLKTSHCFSSGRSVDSLRCCVRCWEERTLVECTPCRLFRMCPFWVSSDSGKCLCKFFTVISGQVR